MKRDVTIQGVDMSVDYDYQPEERMTRDYPGCHEEATVENINIGGKDLDPDIFADCFIRELEEKILKDIAEAKAEARAERALGREERGREERW